MTVHTLGNGTFRARWVIPVTGAPIHDGLVEIANGRIVSVGRCADQGNVIDLGDVALLPGLVNAHTHLEFSDLREPIGKPGILIADWIPEVVRRRAQQQPTPEARAAAIRTGIQESLDCGTRLIGEIATRPWLCDDEIEDSCNAEVGKLADNCLGNDPHIVAFCEVLGLSNVRQREMLSWAETQIGDSRFANVSWGISPHAPYSVPPPMLDQCVASAKKAHIPLAMHLAESLEERRFIENGDGPLRDAFSSMNLPGLDQYPSGVSIESQIDRIGEASQGLLIHGNYLTDTEIECIVRHRDRLGVVYCPRTHAFFGHAPHPVAKLLDLEIPVALGTDSRASNPDLNLWSEVRHLLTHRQDLRPESILRMATVAGADLLGQPHFGRIEPGCDAGLYAIETDATTESAFWNDLALWEPSFR